MDLKQIFSITARTTIEYVKAQLILFVITLIIYAVGFALLDLPVWFLLAFGMALLDALPIVGGALVIMPWSIICFVRGDMHLGGWLLGLWCIAVLLRQVLEPLIVGKKIGIRPLVTFAAIIIGTILWGPIGLILGPIVAAVINAIMAAQQMQQQNGEQQPKSPHNSAPDDTKYIQIK